MSDSPSHIITVDLPEKYATFEGCPKSIGIVELSASQDRAARARCKMNFDDLQDEFIKESIVEMDGEDVRAQRHRAEAFWDKSKSRLRTLVTQAYYDINSPSDDELNWMIDGIESGDGSTDGGKKFIDWKGEPACEYRIPLNEFMPITEDLMSFTVIELNARQEKRARKRCQNKFELLQQETVKASIVAIDGAPVDYTKLGEYMENAKHRLRNLFLAAYQDMNEPEEIDSMDFLDRVRGRSK